MEKYFVVLFLQALVLALSFQSGDSIKCYSCNSESDENCKDPINTDALKASDCVGTGISGLYNSLNKGLKELGNIVGTDFKTGDMPLACQKTVLSDGEKSVVRRSCTISKSSGVDPCSLSGKLEKDLGGKLKVDFCDTCESDGCNGASKPFTGMLFFIAVPSLAVIMSTYFNA